MSSTLFLELLSTAELAESALACLSMRDLAKVQLVCRQIKHVIDGSEKLQRIMFRSSMIKCSALSWKHKPADEMNTWSNSSIEYNVPVDDLLSIPNNQAQAIAVLNPAIPLPSTIRPFYLHILQFSPVVESLFNLAEKGSTYRQMLLCQPAAKEASIQISLGSFDSGERDSRRGRLGRSLALNPPNIWSVDNRTKGPVGFVEAHNNVLIRRRNGVRIGDVVDVLKTTLQARQMALGKSLRFVDAYLILPHHVLWDSNDVLDAQAREKESKRQGLFGDITRNLPIDSDEATPRDMGKASVPVAMD